jgi:V8-like Glu-specific endopeptidase
VDKDIKLIVYKGGVWRHGDPDKPMNFGQKSPGPKFKIILPGVPNRVDVPVPTKSPWQGVALLNFFNQNNLVGVGSGFLCRNDVIVTAKHNLTGENYDAMGIWMAFDSQSNPRPATLVPRAFATHRNLDLAIFILPSQQQGSFELGGVLPPAPAEVTLAGYALPYTNGAVRFSYSTGPLVPTADANVLTYMINTREGDSGAPVFVVTGGLPRAIGVHAEAAAGPQSGNNGVRLNATVVRDLLKMIDWARTQIGGKQ